MDGGGALKKSRGGGGGISPSRRCGSGASATRPESRFTRLHRLQTRLDNRRPGKPSRLCTAQDLAPALDRTSCQVGARFPQPQLSSRSGSGPLPCAAMAKSAWGKPAQT